MTNWVEITKFFGLLLLSIGAGFLFSSIIRQIPLGIPILDKIFPILIFLLFPLTYLAFYGRSKWEK